MANLPAGERRTVRRTGPQWNGHGHSVRTGMVVDLPIAWLGDGDGWETFPPAPAAAEVPVPPVKAKVPVRAAKPRSGRKRGT